MVSLIFDLALALVTVAVATVPSIYLNRRMLKKFPARRPFAWGFFLAFAVLLIGVLSLALAFTDTKERGLLVFTGTAACLLGTLMYRRNRWAWLVSVIIQANPGSWIINGTYLWNRWAEMRDEK